MSDISPSAIQTNAALEEAISKASSQSEILEIMRKAAIEQELVRPDWDPSILTPTGKVTQPQPKTFAKSLTINGHKHILESDSALGLAQAETNLFRELLSPAQPTESVEPVAQPRSDRGQFISVDDAAARAELELKFKRGGIDGATYLAESGAINSYLESKGVSLQDLKQSAEKNYQANWESATAAFLERHPDWQGGDVNTREVGLTLERLGLTGQPSVESIEAAYQDMQKRNAIANNPEVERRKEIHSRLENAKSFSEIQEATALFGRR